MIRKNTPFGLLSALLTAVALVPGLISSAQAQTGPVFSDDIAPIIYTSCTPCHRQGGIAPFALESYQDVRTYAFSIQNAVNNKHMPPWPPDPTYKRFKGERTLPQDQIDAISAWVDNNMPRGNPANDPPMPIFQDSSALPVAPQASFRIQPYTVQTDIDEYRCFVIPTSGNADRWIKMLEMMPANRSIVHHILLYSDTSGTSRRLDSLDPGPGYTSVGGIGASQADLLGGWAPGSDPIKWPLTFGSRLRKNTDLVMQVHYAPGNQGKRDSSSVNMVFHPTGTTGIREVYQVPILNHETSMTNGPLVLDSNQIKVFYERFVNFLDLTVLSVFPHGHLLCRNWEVYATNATGTDTTRFIKIPDWHFHWQGSYFFQKPVKFSRGMILNGRATYDNTANNPDNPNNPPRRVTAGEGTQDEMMLVYFAFAAYRAGDENLIIDSSILVTENRKPISGGWQVTLTNVQNNRPTLASSLPIKKITITDASGRITYTGANPETGLPFAHQPNGIYFVVVENSLGQRKTVRWARL